MHSLISVVGAVNRIDWWAIGSYHVCAVCRVGDRVHLARRLGQGDGNEAPLLPICDGCFAVCNEVYVIAQRLVRAVPEPAFGLPQMAIRLMAQRLALLRAIPEGAGGGACLGESSRGLDEPPVAPCFWCGDWAISSSGVDKGVSLIDPDHPAEKWISAVIHCRCLRAAKEHVHTEWLDRCMMSLAFALPLLPELRQVVCVFVCRLAVIGIGDAVATKLPVWHATS